MNFETRGVMLWCLPIFMNKANMWRVVTLLKYSTFAVAYRNPQYAKKPALAMTKANLRLPG